MTYRTSLTLKMRLLLFLVAVVGCQARGNPASATVPSEQTDASAAESSTAGSFVTASQGRFWLDGTPHVFVGTNFWQCMNLGSSGEGGDRSRLVNELDRLLTLGVTNLRIVAASEGPNSEPFRMVPALMVEPGVYDDALWEGLDFCMAEISRRGMRAVLVLNNYWFWSGGMGQYVAWAQGGSIPYPGDWNTYMSYASQFYSCDECQTWYRSHIEKLVTRTNTYMEIAYKDDPAIFAWELANEPRAYPQAWIDETAGFIKLLDANHMVTTGSEGAPPGASQDFVRTHSSSNIDYATVHIWPQNWGWYDPERPATYDAAEAKALEYFRQHVYDAAVHLKKPLVLEEFGLARDWQPLVNNLDPSATTQNRDRFYQAMFGEALEWMIKGGPVAGDNFWAWGGSARPGDSWTGDPPHEPSGWYSVYDSDRSTLEIIAAHAAEVQKLEK